VGLRGWSPAFLSAQAASCLMPWIVKLSASPGVCSQGWVEDNLWSRGRASKRLRKVPQTHSAWPLRQTLGVGIMFL
jgi:hypothetical protein